MSIAQMKNTPHDHIPEEFSVDDLKESGFTDAEIDLLSKGDDTDPPLVTIEAKPDDTPENDDIDGDDGLGNPPIEPQAAPVVEQPKPAPKIEIPDTADAERVISEMDRKLDAIQTDYDNGELTPEELRAQTRALIEEQARAQILIDQANSAMQAARHTAEQSFYSTLDAYYEANNAAALLSEDHLARWDANLRAVTGNTALQSLPYERMIQLAHERYASEYQAIHGKPLPIAVPKPGQNVQKLTPRDASTRPEAIQTLSGVNGDLTDAISDSRAAALDRMAAEDPLQAEAQLAQMDRDAEERWLRGA